MKQTEKYMLNLMESADSLSAKTLNENAEKVETALSEASQAVAARAMVACGSYTGNGARSITLQTPGFVPRIVLMRSSGTMTSGLSEGSGMFVRDGWCLWLGADMATSYEVYAYSEEAGETVRESVNTTVRFEPKNGGITWKIPDLPKKYSGVLGDGGPGAINNSPGEIYEWIAMGMAQ